MQVALSFLSLEIYNSIPAFKRATLFVQIIAGDCRNVDFVRRAVTGVDAVICCLGTTAFPSLRFFSLLQQSKRQVRQSKHMPLKQDVSILLDRSESEVGTA